MRRMGPLRLLNLVLPPLQPLAGALAPVFGVGTTIAAMTEQSRTPAVPAGYAFGIWSLLFLLAILYGIWQALPAQRDSRLLAALRGPLALAFALNIAWMLAAQLLGNGWHLVLIMGGLVAATLTALGRVVRAPPASGAERWLVRPLAGLLAGWISAATFANLSITARWAGFGWFGLSESGAAALVVLLAAGFGAAVLLRLHGAPWYAAGLAWALLAILVANLWLRLPDPATALAAALGLAAVVLAAFLGRRRARGAAAG
ncbi:hypothetical protein [Crenalkalicoccus roseus]|uniref:hypothetical protein n=1 Tax=Crenalkalicoccus roseus TaxID=1485588 RepID=UPI001080E9C9|nr:hypothetical protein [Crenalkalicoccus roseus]